MRPSNLILLPLCLAAGLASPLEGQHAHGGAADARLGRVRFPVSCRGEAGRHFERGVALLHSFWYEEAGQAFGRAADADPGCAMAHWGVAMSRFHPLWVPPSRADYAAGLESARRAQRGSRPGTAGRRWADAVARYYEGYETVDHRVRMAAYEAAMRDLAARDPGNEEARIFHALALIANGQLNASDTTYARQREAARILEPLYQRHPDHPGLAHYLIHAYDSPALAAAGVPAAGRYAEIAPAVPHAQHMPSHIYVRVGRWRDVVASNLRSAEAARRFEVEQGFRGLWDQRAHALDYLVYGYLQLGQIGPARDIAAQLAHVTETVPADALIAEYPLAAIPARLALEREDWAAAAQLPIRRAPAWRGAEAITHFARALGSARTRRPAAARRELESLAALERALAAAGGAQTYWAGQVRIQREAAGAWVAWLQGDTTEALRRASAAADLEDATEKHPVTPGPVLPARELLADLLVAAGRTAEAHEEYRAVLRRQPGRARSLAGERATGAAAGQASR